MKSDTRKLKQVCQSLLRMGQVQNEICLPDGVVLPLAEYTDVDQLEVKLKDNNVSMQLVILLQLPSLMTKCYAMLVSHMDDFEKD